MKVYVDGYVLTVRKSQDNSKRSSFEFLLLGDGNYQRSTILSVVGDGVKSSLTDKVRIEIIQQSYVDKRTGELRTFWRKTDTPAVPVR